jgi:hypothetical protein
MIKFPISQCPKCGRKTEVMLSNNPLSGTTICFDCINNNLSSKNLEHAEFFCRTYNLPWMPDLWLELSKEENIDLFKEYTLVVLNDDQNKPNLAFTSSTKDLWSRTNKEWEKCRSFSQILKKLTPLRESYLDRGHLKWGEQYTFEELLKLDSIYSRTLKSNNITNPMQKEAVKTLCKLQVEMDEAIRAKDAKAIKDFSSAWANFAKQADLENMINETKTDDITTVAELYDYMEKSGFQFKFYDGFDRDEVDRSIKDIQDTNRRLILESTGLQQLLEDMIRQKAETTEMEHARNIAETESIQDLLNFSPADNEVDTEEDSDAITADFSEEEEIPSHLRIVRKED